MKTAFSLLLALLASPDIAIHAQGDVREQIQKIYDRASTAAMAARTLADVDTIHNWLDMPDCVYTDFGQQPRNWAEQRVYAAADLRTPLTSFSNQIETLRQEGAITAITTTLVKGAARIVDGGGQFGTPGAIHEVETTATVRDVWIKVPDGWRRKSHTKIIGNKITAIDGRPSK